MTDIDWSKWLGIVVKAANGVGKLRKRICRHRRTAMVIYGAEYGRLFFQHLISDINEIAGLAGIDLVHLGATGSALHRSLASLKVHRPYIDGIMVLPTTFSGADKAAIVQFLQEMKLPTAVLDNRDNFFVPVLPNVAYRYFDNGAAAELFARHLGQVTLVQQDLPLSSDEQTRISAFSRRSSISVSSLRPRETAFETFLSLDITNTTDIVCMNDDQAIGVDDALHARAVCGVAMRNINVWSYDCCASMDVRIRDEGRYFRGGVRQDTKMLATEAIAALGMLFNGENADSRSFAPKWCGPTATEGSSARQ
ncbi:MAG: hypothetical protein ACM3W4_11735 [Ignavibacteriales bacterium]